MLETEKRTAFWLKPALALGAGGGLLLSGHPFFAWPCWFIGIACLFLAATRFDFHSLIAWACLVSLLAALGFSSVHDGFLFNWSAFWGAAVLRFAWLLLALLLLSAGRGRFGRAWPFYGALAISGCEILYGLFPFGHVLGSSHLFVAAPLLTQSAWLGGGSFLVFLLAMVCTTTVTAFSADSRISTQSAFGQMALILALILGIGVARLTGKTEKPIRLAAATVRLPEQMPTEPNAWLLARYEPVARDAAAAGAGVLVLPEGQFPAMDKAELGIILGGLRGMAARHRLPILAGIRRKEENGSRFHNEAVFIARDGAVVTNYSKAHPLPFMEQSIPGRSAGTLIPGQEGFGVLICYDDILPGSFRTLAKKGARFALVPSNDWREIAELHNRIVHLRATANGLPTLRSTSGGFLSAIDGQGREIDRKSFFDAETTVLLADLPPVAGTAPYVMAGTWMEYKEGLAAVLLILFSLLFGKSVHPSRNAGTGLTSRRGGMPY